MKHREIWRRGKEFLAHAIVELQAFGFDAISKWPEYPEIPSIDLRIPADLNSVRFTLMKDTQPDGTIRVAIQMYRYRFLGVGSMTANGFFISKGNAVRPLAEKDLWELT